MTPDTSKLFSDLASYGLPKFFPSPAIPVSFNFDQGLAAEETFPIEEFQALSGEVLTEDRGRALEYTSLGPNERTGSIEYVQSYASTESRLGHTVLREHIAAWLSSKGDRRDLEAAGIILTLGSVQALAYAINAFVSAGDGVIVEASSFPFALRFLQMRGATMAHVPVDGDGMDVDAVERQIETFQAEGVRPKLIYTIPTFQLPTGAVMSLERRQRLVDLASRHEIVLIEDNVYGDLRFEGEPVPTLLSIDRSGFVMQSHSFSKILAPGIRIGWMAGHPDMITGLAAVRQDLGVSQWLSRMMARYMAKGQLEAHITKANAVYRRKRDIAVEAVRRQCGPWVTFDVPEGGFYLWLRLSDDVDWDRAREEATNGGVLCRPGEMFTGDETGARFLRLAYSHVSEDELRRGIEVLGKAVTASVKG
jgi:2-aminoadipate transaminase